MKKVILFYIICLSSILISCAKKNNPVAEFLGERLSAAVTYRFSGEDVSDFFINPSKAYISGYFMFEPNLANDVIFGFDIEWFEGVTTPYYLEGGDWMAFAGFTQSGHLWVPVGSPENLQGIPTNGDNVTVFDSQGELKPNTWYHMTIECDYKKRNFSSVKLKGDDLDIEFDLSDEQLEYPNYVAYDNPTLTMYCFASRSATLAWENKMGNSKVYFDDIEAGIWDGISYKIILSNGFESPNQITNAPYDFSSQSNPINSVLENIWYSENENAILRFSNKNVRSGNYSMECNARLLR